MNVPFLDLQTHHAHLRTEFHCALDEILDSSDFSGGTAIHRFEADFANYCGTRNTVGVGSGTDALWLALLGCGVGPGDEVITVPMTFIATVEAIHLCGARTVFVDIDPQTYTINPTQIEARITSRTKAIVPVHLFGQPAKIDAILEIAKHHDLHVIEDAAQAHGAEYHGKKVGTFGTAGCFSFYPTKNLGALGEGGAVVTNNDELANRIRILANHGQTSKNHHASIGWNSRLDAIQAAFLSLKLKRLDMENQRRRENASIYHDHLSRLDGITRPFSAPNQLHAQHIYAVHAEDRTGLIEQFNKSKIGYGIHYPIPAHLQKPYWPLGYREGDFPISESCAAHLLSLPVHPCLSHDQIGHVVETITRFSNKGKTERSFEYQPTCP